MAKRRVVITGAAGYVGMRGGSLSALKEILGHAHLKMTLRYGHLSPAHLRNEMAKTERVGLAAAAPAGVSTNQTHEPVPDAQQFGKVAS